MPTAYSYLRFSTPEQARGDSFRRQTEMARQYAVAHGLTLDKSLTFHDLGVSAYRGANAETGRLGDFLAAVSAGLVAPGSYLLIESLDRLSRRAARRALRTLEAIVDAGVAVATLNDGKVYTRENLDEDPMSLLMALLIFIRSNEESREKARRIRSAWSNKRATAATTALTARAPAWLRLVNGRWEIIEDRAAVVRRIFDATLGGVGQHVLRGQFNAEKVPVFGRGARWHRSYIAKILANPAVVGTMTPHTLDHIDGRRVRRPQEPVPGYWPAIVPAEQFEAVQAMASTRAPLRGRNAGLRNVLGGLARCPSCGGSMLRAMKGGKNGRPGLPKLVCSRARSGAGCEYRSVDYAQVEAALAHSMARAVAEAPAGSLEIDAQLQHVEASIHGGAEQLEELVEAVADGELRNSPALAGKIRDLEMAVDALQDRRRELERQAAATASPLVARRLSRLVDAFTAPLDVKAANTLLRQSATGVTVNYLDGVLLIDWCHGGQSRVRYELPIAAPGRLTSEGQLAGP